jgi:hypothetical protein
VSGTAAALTAFGATRVTQLHSLLTAGAVADAKYGKMTGARWVRAVDTCTSTNTKDLGVGGDVELVQWTSPFPDQGSQIQRTNGLGDVLISSESSRKVPPSATKTLCRRAVSTTHVPQMAIFDFDMWPVVIDEIYNQVCTNDPPVLTSELLSHTPSAVAGITEVARGGCSLHHRSIAVLWSLTHSGHCADKLANTTTSGGTGAWRQRLRHDGRLGP